MRLNHWIVTGALLLASLTPVSAAEYTLEMYLSKVESDNLDLAIARRDLSLAEQSVIQARSALLPSVGLQGSYTRNLLDIEKSTAVAASTDGSGGTYPFIYKDTDSNFDNEVVMGIGVKQKIFDAAAIAALSQAKKGREVRAEAFETTRRSVRCAAKKLYAQAQLTLAVLEVMDTSEKAAAANFRSVSMKAQAGVATELDALLSEVDWRQKIPAIEEARKNNELVLIAMKNLAGIPLTESLELSRDTDEVPSMPAEVELSAVLSSRPDYRISLLSRELSDIAKKAAFASFLPTLSGSYSWGHVSYSGFTNDATYKTDSSSLSLAVTLPLFTGFYRTSLVKSARFAQEKSAIDLQKKADSIEQELLGIRLRLSEANTRIESARFLEAATKRATALAKSSYDNGLGTQLQVTDASSKYDQSRLALRNAIYTYRAACYDWDYAIGKTD